MHPAGRHLWLASDDAAFRALTGEEVVPAPVPVPERKSGRVITVTVALVLMSAGTIAAVNEPRLNGMRLAAVLVVLAGGLLLIQVRRVWPW